MGRCAAGMSLLVTQVNPCHTFSIAFSLRCFCTLLFLPRGPCFCLCLCSKVGDDVHGPHGQRSSCHCSSRTWAPCFPVALCIQFPLYQGLCNTNNEQLGAFCTNIHKHICLRPEVKPAYTAMDPPSNSNILNHCQFCRSPLTFAAPSHPPTIQLDPHPTQGSRIEESFILLDDALAARRSQFAAQDGMWLHTLCHSTPSTRPHAQPPHPQPLQRPTAAWRNRSW